MTDWSSCGCTAQHKGFAMAKEPQKKIRRGHSRLASDYVWVSGVLPTLFTVMLHIYQKLMFHISIGRMAMWQIKEST